MEKIKVYISAGWFDKFQDEALTYLEEIFDKDKFEIYSPRKEIKLEGKEGIEMQNFVFEENCKNIESCDLIVSSTVGKDMGTLWENGYGFKCGKPIIYTFFDTRFENVKFNLMLAASGIGAFVNKEKFTTFLNKVTKENVNTIKERYEGEFE